MNILGIETSCDETGVAIYNDSRGLVAAQLYSQIALHAPHGGVVPELASRDHVTRLVPLIEQTLREADLTLSSLDAIAYTAGPGLLGALLVGAGVAKSLAYALTIPAIAVHHMEGHLLAPLLEAPAPAYPFLALLVSGGHTQWVAVQSFGQYELLGESVDDAVGEAFDKTAKLLGLPYPGGAALSMLAREGDPRRFAFPRPMTDRPGLDMSFSGLKTAVLHTVQQHTLTESLRADIAASFQQAVIDTLMIKGGRAIVQTGLARLVVAGGVSANVPLRAALRTLPVDVYFPRHEFCTDNGAMIAYAGYCRFQHGARDATLAISPQARWLLTDIENHAQ